MGKIKKTRVRSSKNEKLQHKSGLIDSLLAGNQLKKSTTNSTPEKVSLLNTFQICFLFD